MIRIEQLSFSYEGNEKKVLDDINLTVEDGDFVGIIGASGAGKSTLTYAINGVIPHHFGGHYFGHVYVGDMDVFDTPLTDISRLIGTVFQDIDSQMVSTIVEDELLYGMENFGVPKEEMEGRIEEALGAVGISRLRSRDINSLSGGQKQKVAVAAILALKPQILVLDEPTGELDPRSSRQIFTVLRELNEKHGITVIIVEQKIMLLCEFVKKLVVMENGRLLYSDEVHKVLAHSDKLEEAGVKCPRIVTLSGMLKAEGLGTGAIAINLEEAQAMVEESMQMLGHPDNADSKMAHVLQMGDADGKGGARA